MKRALRFLREKRVHTWLGGYARHLWSRQTAPPVKGPRHLLFALCDHFEPLWGDASDERGDARMRGWTEGYPRFAREFRDADGRPPRHSFFFPGEQYRPRWLEGLADLTRGGFGEVELHLHHDGDTPERLRADLKSYLERYAAHGHFTRGADGRPRYAFIHGNWCLANGRRDGRYCGVDEEVSLLFEAGCYADFTYPSAPDEAQPGIVNQIYWPIGDLRARRAYERGIRARVGEVLDDRLLMIQGPLGIRARRARLPLRIEGANIAAGDPPTPERLRSWVSQGIHVEGRPEWVFVKVHTHGAPEREAEALLGDAGRALHRELGTRYNDGERWILHYVTAREMFNVAVAAMEGARGDPGLYRDHRLAPPPAALGEARPPRVEQDA